MKAITLLRSIMGSGDSGGGGGTTPPAAWHATLPEDIRTAPSLIKYKSVEELARGHVNAEALIGKKRLEAPNDKWGDNEWKAFYKEIGVPETPDAYKLPDKLKNLEGIQLDEEKLKKVNAALHTAGLTPKQHAAVLEYYAGTLSESAAAQQASQDAAMQAGITKLKGDWGVNYEQNLDVAKSVLKKFGGEATLARLTETGFANDPDFIQMLHKIGSGMLEDKGRGGSGGGLQILDSTAALNEIKTLRMDTDFQKAMNDARNPGHAAAVERWTALHAKAYEGQKEPA
jgi:hypothetical protein